MDSAADGNRKLIAGDASDRKFYRIQSHKPGQEDAICMEFPTWEGGFGGDPISWLEMHAALAKMEIPIPRVLKVDKENLCIFTEDLGDEFLSSVPKEQFLARYKEAISLLIKAQYPISAISNPAEKKAFDFEKLYTEMAFFIKYFLNGFLHLDIQEEKSSTEGIYSDLKNLCQALDQRPRVLCHRDYHSRNIMVKNKRIYWIDFQDARMGPHTYDVVSLVRDSYVDMDWKTRNILFDFYFEELNKIRSKKGLPEFPKQEYDLELKLMGLQRNLKAIGSFAYLSMEKSKPNYIQYIKPTLALICSDQADASDLFPHLFSLLKKINSGDAT